MADEPQIALALGGGGARASYQAGVLRALAKTFPSLRVGIWTGVSAGAINTAFLTNHGGVLAGGADDLADLWSNLRISDVFRTSPGALVARMFRTAAQMTTGIPPGVDPIQGMVDTEPLRGFLRGVLGSVDGSLPAINANLAAGRLDAVAITTTRYATAQSVTFCAGRQMRAWDQHLN